MFHWRRSVAIVALVFGVAATAASAAEVRSLSIPPGDFDTRFAASEGAVAGAQALQPPAPAAQPATILPTLTPHDRGVVMHLVRTTLVALHQANMTGNYTVFRDLGSPDFQQQNTSSDLGDIFGPLRKSGIALDVVTLFDPIIQKAGLNADKSLEIAATLATDPTPVKFDLVYQNVEGAWRLFKIALGPDRAAMAQAPKGPPATE